MNYLDSYLAGTFEIISKPIMILTDANAALLLSYINFKIKHHKTDNVFIKFSELKEQFGFTRQNIRSAVKKLEDNLLIEVRRGGIGNLQYYKINNNVVNCIIDKYLDDISGDNQSLETRINVRGAKSVPQTGKKCPSEGQKVPHPYNIHKNILNSIHNVMSFWNQQNIIKHRKLTDTIQSSINSKLKYYSEEEIKKSIVNYNFILKSDNYYLTYRWKLDEFLKRKMEVFMDIEIAKQNYAINKKKIRDQETADNSEIKQKIKEATK